MSRRKRTRAPQRCELLEDADGVTWLMYGRDIVAPDGTDTGITCWIYDLPKGCAGYDEYWRTFRRMLDERRAQGEVINMITREELAARHV